MIITYDKANGYLKKWQEILRLRDWDIKIKLVEEEWRKSGDIKVDECNKQAILMLNNKNPKVKNTEEVIIHELIHLRLWKMDQMIERLINNLYGEDEKDPKRNVMYSEFMIALEKTTGELTKSFVALAAENKEFSFGYVEEKIRKELNSNIKSNYSAM